MVRVNHTKARVLEGQVAIGGSINFYAPVLVEQYGVMGFDWVWIDCEHGSSNDSETENMVRAAELYDLTPIVRVPNALPSTLLRFLDRGAQGLIVPHISTRQEAEAVARASHYYPMGDRSSATGGRTNQLGSGLPPAEYYEAANRETLVKRGADSVVEALYTLFRFPEDFHLLLARSPQPDRFNYLCS
jgi:4-hydroxy-2-oxoheptanedioate aldolase